MNESSDIYGVQAHVRVIIEIKSHSLSLYLSLEQSNHTAKDVKFYRKLLSERMYMEGRREKCSLFIVHYLSAGDDENYYYQYHHHWPIQSIFAIARSIDWKRFPGEDFKIEAKNWL